MGKPVKKDNKIKQPPKPAIPSGPFHFKGTRFHYIFTLTVVAFCFLLYGNSVSNGFSMDDEFVLHGDTIVQKGFKGIPQLFKTRYAWDQKGAYGYRPIVKITFAIEQKFFGNSPHAGHVLEILMYAFFCIFLFYFLRKIFYNEVSDYFLFIVMSVFIAHPMHTEVVDSLKNRDILLVVIFGFYCTYAFIKTFETKNIFKRVLWVVSAMMAFVMAYLSKPDAIIFMAITPLVLFFVQRGKYKPALWSVLFIFIARTLTHIFVRSVLPSIHHHRTFIFIEQPLMDTHFYQRIGLGLYSLGFYIGKLIFPLKMACYYGYDEINPHPGWSDPRLLFGLALIGVWIYLVIKNRRDRGILLFTLLFFGGTMFSYMNIVRVGPGIVADRFMFLPSLGFVMVIVYGLYKLLKLPPERKPFGQNVRYLYIIIGLATLAYSGRTIVRNPNWESHLSIYEHDVKAAPRSAKLQSLLAAAYMQQVQEHPDMSNDDKIRYYKLSEDAYTASVDIYPEYVTSLNNLGMIQFNYYRNLNKAIEYFNKALKADSNYTEALFNMAAAYEAAGKKDVAEYYFLRTIQTNPEYYLGYVYLSKLYFEEGKLDRILQFNQDAIKQGHISDVVYVNIGNVYLSRQDTLKAIDNFQKALSYYPDNQYLSQFLSKYYANHNDSAKAEYYRNLSVRATERKSRVFSEK